MNEPDPLETELAELRPQAVSPETMSRIAGRLAPVARSQSRRWTVAVVGSLIAAGIVTAILLQRDGQQIVENDKPLIVPQIEEARLFDDTLPSIWTYSRVLTRSSTDLDAVLDKHAVAVLSQDHVRGMRSLMSDLETHLSQGDL
jgi:hypothetical protein